jgi:hypothetical protein
MTGIIKQGFLLMMLLGLAQTTVARELPRIDDMPEGLERPTTMPEPIRGYRERFNAIESEKLRISLEGSSGFVEGKVCDFCEQITVTITPQTRAFEDDNEVPLSRAAGRLGRYATVIYELETKNVTEIRW